MGRLLTSLKNFNSDGKSKFVNENEYENEKLFLYQKLAPNSVSISNSSFENVSA